MFYISKTPLRVSFFSGGDMSSFYSVEPGACLSCTINKFVYVSAHWVPYTKIRTSYDRVEDSDGIQYMQHLITKNALDYFGVDKEIAISSSADVRFSGSGLGSSSAFTVGLVRALQGHTNWSSNRNSSDSNILAKIACHIEIDKCGYKIGKQDQYAAAFGSLNLFGFNADGTVDRINHNQPEDEILNITKELSKKLLLIYSGKQRLADDILGKQQIRIQNDKNSWDALARNRDRAFEAFSFLTNGRYDAFGELLHWAWEDKKKVTDGISTPHIDLIYGAARKAGAIGGKVIGAGGGGFMLFYAPENKHVDIIRSIKSVASTDCLHYPFEFYHKGSELKCV
jgi:D-glycero-alpha-D-manno-heptose-7-phosphate kinase